MAKILYFVSIFQKRLTLNFWTGKVSLVTLWCNCTARPAQTAVVSLLGKTPACNPPAIGHNWGGANQSKCKQMHETHHKQNAPANNTSEKFLVKSQGVNFVLFWKYVVPSSEDFFDQFKTSVVLDREKTAPKDQWEENQRESKTEKGLSGRWQRYGGVHLCLD